MRRIHFLRWVSKTSKMSLYGPRVTVTQLLHTTLLFLLTTVLRAVWLAWFWFCPTAETKPNKRILVWEEGEQCWLREKRVSEAKAVFIQESFNQDLRAEVVDVLLLFLSRRKYERWAFSFPSRIRITLTTSSTTRTRNEGNGTGSWKRVELNSKRERNRESYDFVHI